jgi:hypothetical protein
MYTHLTNIMKIHKSITLILSVVACTLLALLLREKYILRVTTQDPALTPVHEVNSFESCVQAGYPVTGTTTKQCTTNDGRVYAQEINQSPTYINATKDLIVVSLPLPGNVTGKEFSIIGKARGTWFFEASFPVEVLDKDGKTLFSGGAHAEGDWMTTDFVPFKIDVKVPQSYIGKATIVLKKDNPSGLPEHDASVMYPITIEY